jgi:hypothetical protein
VPGNPGTLKIFLSLLYIAVDCCAWSQFTLVKGIFYVLSQCVVLSRLLAAVFSKELSKAILQFSQKYAAIGKG